MVIGIDAEELDYYDCSIDERINLLLNDELWGELLEDKNCSLHATTNDCSCCS
jgi:hypothetical protein